MVAIKDFGMPSCCENCNMCVNRNLDTFYCCITLNDVNIDEKSHDCPLVEIEERKVEKLEKIKQIVKQVESLHPEVAIGDREGIRKIKEVLEQE